MHRWGARPSSVLSFVCEVCQVNGPVVSRDGTSFLPAIATCLSDALDGSIVGVFGHGGDSHVVTREMFCLIGNAG